MKRNHNRALLAVVLLLLALAPACKKKEEAPAPPPGPGAAAPPPAAPQAAVQKPLSSARGAVADPYDFRNRRDPFKPFVTAEPAPPAAGAPGAPAPTGDGLPIQSFEVTRFRVTGIVAGIAQNRALLVDPQGRPYVVQVGMQIGNSEGRITRITASTVEVVERYRDDKGQLKKRKVVLTLAKKR